MLLVLQLGTDGHDHLANVNPGHSALGLSKGTLNASLEATLGQCKNQERKHRTYVYVLIVTEVLEDWEDSVNIDSLTAELVPEKETMDVWCGPILRALSVRQESHTFLGRKREWFKIEDAIKVLQYHKPVQASYFETLRQGYSANNGTPVVATTYSVSAQSSMSGIR
ncbi:Nudix hydrolase 3 [Saguinus oedipus]|uniref:Nudix hydrolase 3 n=1 Tax=Saguinus oedipus TaxID=9490 RepID=A0ABQ9VW52_SAGOE|nr:Nudix hydrolase 3 [Saguinus oedipus]